MSPRAAPAAWPAPGAPRRPLPLHARLGPAATAGPAPLARPQSPPVAARGRPRPAPHTPHFRAEGAAPPPPKPPPPGGHAPSAHTPRLQPFRAAENEPALLAPSGPRERVCRALTHHHPRPSGRARARLPRLQPVLLPLRATGAPPAFQVCRHLYGSQLPSLPRAQGEGARADRIRRAGPAGRVGPVGKVKDGKKVGRGSMGGVLWERKAELTKGTGPAERAAGIEGRGLRKGEGGKPKAGPARGAGPGEGAQNYNLFFSPFTFHSCRHWEDFLCSRLPIQTCQGSFNATEHVRTLQNKTSNFNQSPRSNSSLTMRSGRIGLPKSTLQIGVSRSRP